MGIQNSSKPWNWQVVLLFFFYTKNWTCAQLHYSIAEELDPRTFVGNVAQDLGIQTAAISHRRIQLGSAGNRIYFDVDQKNGVLTTTERIDRELLCGSNLKCLLPLELVLENPLELQRIVIEILDINDNSPTFSKSEHILRMTEVLAFPGSRFPLEEAHDLDVGINGVQHYRLNQNQYFSLSSRIQEDGTPFPELVLEKALDREDKVEHQLILTAIDGGTPPRTGTSQITVKILDLNDNAPTFDSNVYKVSLLENIPVNSVVIQLNASDLDEGPNAEIEYLYDIRTSDIIQQLFSLNPHTGIIYTKGVIDSEVSNFYEINVRAKDNGVPHLEGHCRIQVEVIDVNDYPPEILLTSLFSEILEGTAVGTTIGLFNVKDKDSGKNGEVMLSLSPKLPFKIKSFKDHFTLITDGILDRESISQYEITLIATDMGSPSLSTQRTITLNISDINDNPPSFLNPNFISYIQENNEPGHLLYTLSAMDPDEGKNAELTYSIVDSHIYGSPVSSFVYINPKTGSIYAQRSYDYEQVQVLEIIVRVEDSGSPRLFSNATIFIFILDTNDNSPHVFYPKLSQELIGQQKVSKSVPIGHLVSKVSAVDSDSGRNAWLTYKFVEVTDSSLFRLSTHTGEIRTLRNILETDDSVQTLVISVSDHGEPSLSTTVTVLLTLEDHESESPIFHDFISGPKTDITMYLIISLVAISVVSLVTFLILLAKCVKKENNFCHSGCCSLNNSESKHYTDTHRPTLHLNMDGTLKYMEVRMEPSEPQYYRTYCSQTTENKDLNFLKPLNFPELKELVNGTDTMLSGVFSSSKPSQQAQPNTDWRFSQAQRPGTSGAAQPTEETGVWPNNQFETERLQAMILASANEAAEGSSALGAGNGTMGLSARYGPQFTLQHVPDYRQNIYIPGTTSTLTNAAGKRDGKAAAPSGGNKKKSGKKEKK